VSDILKRGSRGARVGDWQRELNRLGYGLEKDNDFGPATEWATRDFQKRAGIVLDGRVGPQTWRAALAAQVPLPDQPTLPPAPPADEVRAGRYAEELYRTPNHSIGRSIRPEGVVVHHTCGTWDGDTSWIMNGVNPSRGIWASYHCLINVDGTRRVFGPDTARMWHAGRSSWAGRSSCNDFMLGVAFSGDSYPERRFGWDLNEDQIASALEWLDRRVMAWGIRRDMITDHRQVSPDRKDDLNPAAWATLAAAIEREVYA